MSKPISLKKQFESMNTGDVMITKPPRTGIYVAAKRAGFKVSTEELADGQIQVTIGEKIVVQPKPKISQFDQTLNVLKEWTTETRLKLFEHFELCCGMNRGECVCPEAEFEDDAPHPRSSLVPMNFESGYQESTPLTSADSNAARKSTIESLRNVISGTDYTIAPPVVEDEWHFTKDRPEFNDNGRVYRQQYLVQNPKRRRSVRVDEDDHERIIE